MDLLTLVQKLQALAQAGLTYAKDPFDRDRYEQLQALASQLLAEKLATDSGEVGRVFSLEQGYPTPKVDVRAVVPRENKLLFVREVTDSRWALPGGWADIGESASEVTARETYEETGYVVRPTRILAVYDRAKHAHPKSYWYTYKIFFLCKLVGGEAKLSHESTAVDFFGEGELPELSLPRVTKAQILRMFELTQKPDSPPDFD